MPNWSTFRGLCVLTAAILSGQVPPPAQAASYTAGVSVVGRAQGGGDGSVADFQDSAEVGWQSSPASSFAWRSANSFGVLSIAQADASTGVGGGIHLMTLASGSNPPVRSWANSNAWATGGVMDSFVFSAPGLAAGTHATATIAFDISGSLQVNQLGVAVPEGMRYASWAEWQADLYLGDGASWLAQWHGWRHDAITNGSFESMGNAMPGRVLIDVPVVIGAPVVFDMRAAVHAGGAAETQVALLGNAVFEGTGAAYFGHTFAWGGVQSLKVNGVDITGYTAVSDSSGFDFAQAYVAAVPEPQSAWLLVTGLVLMAWRHRRSRAGL